MSDFLAIKGLTGELKVSHKKGPFGLTLSTRELVVQKPHLNYYIRFEKIISIVPCQGVKLDRRVMSAVRQNVEWAYDSAAAGSTYYAIYASEVIVHHRGGLHHTGPMEFRLPVYGLVLEELARYSGLTVI